MIASVVIVVASRSVFWRKIAFWMSLVISSAIQLAVVHAWTKKVPDLSRAQGKGAVFLGLVLLLAVYGLVRFLQRMFYGKEPKNA
jgi:NADH:ubiquinone oxidoreductase subunit 4 (subunit M)